MKPFGPHLTIAAVALLACAPCFADDPKPEAPKAADTKPADSKISEDLQLSGDALKALAEIGDEQALAALKKAKESDGKLALSQDEALTFIKRAKEKGLLKPGARSTASELQRVGDALKGLAEIGDEEAVAAIKKARENGGKLELTPDQGLSLVKRARENGLLKDADNAAKNTTPAAQAADKPNLKTTNAALKALAENGDKAAAEALKGGVENGGKLELSPADANKFILQAKARGLLKPAPAN